ncbi:MAG: hypothetical protein JRF38_05715 [Deltaproteobacteria bacterium]|jgi:hypothetical protein|nr:hypothetical protein [Deltaproteobacteria bacterium]
MKLVAYQYHDGELKELWGWSSDDESRPYAGQGAHFRFGHQGADIPDGRRLGIQRFATV